MKKIPFNRSTFLTAITMLAAGLLIGWFARPSTSGGTEQHEDQTDQTDTAKTIIWTCTMHPQIRLPEPGKCPICGMELVPLEDNTSVENPMEIKMSPAAMQLANVQTAIVGFGMPAREVRMNGKVQPDERRIFSQATHLNGRVEQLSVNFTGETVRRGQKLASIYSPELVTAQEELFSALKIRDMQPALFNAAKEKLKNWKLTDRQIDEILAAGKPQERFPILADVGGIVSAKKVNLGDYVMRGMPLYDIMDLSKVWILFDVYENDMPWVRPGSLVKFSLQSIPGETFTGKIAFIDPVINPTTRVATARVEMPNASGKFKPEMFVSGVIKTQLSGKKEGIVVPKSAVMWTGERSVVYLKKTTESGIGFLMREVTLGPLTSDGYLIKAGLAPGEEIAVNGTFSIDAAAQLAGKPSMMSPDGGIAMSGHQHAGGASPAAENTPRQETSKPAKSAVKRLFDGYFPLKDALEKSDLAAAREQASHLKAAFDQTSMSLFTGTAHNHWMNHSGAAVEALNKLIAAKNLQDARNQFKPFSQQMLGLAKAFGPFEAPMYVMHCPMADNNTGADWLSLYKEIKNPYFGKDMLDCGSITETIK